MKTSARESRIYNCNSSCKGFWGGSLLEETDEVSDLK
jgi:hypothetical protein